MSLKKFDKYPMHFNWKDAFGCSSLILGLFLAAVTLNGKNDPQLKKQETMVSLAEKQLQSIVIPQTIPQEGDENFIGPPAPFVGPLPSPAMIEKSQKNKPPFQGIIKQVFNKKYSVN